MAGKVSFSKANLKLEEITAHYDDLWQALKIYYNPLKYQKVVPNKFITCSLRELEREWATRCNELDKSFSLTLLAALEASLQIDYLQRCYTRRKDVLSLEFRKIYKRKASRPALVDDILHTWQKCCPELKNIVSALSGAFKYRHWLAHGRYWTPKFGKKYDYSDIYTLAYVVYDTFRLIRGN